ncbi:MAG: hypothetical protein KJ734_12555 [Chloroflexi bacterium]|nr:hypothetical protein [Chloroflexota bacterium]
MPVFAVRTFEKWPVTAQYTVRADTLDEAIGKIKNGEVAYDEHEHDGIGDEVIEVLNVQSEDDGPE